MTLTEKIQTALIGADFPGVAETERLLSEIIGLKTTWYDTCIDDGVDDDETEDQYVMRSCFSTEHNEITVRVYYGDVTEEIGYVDVAEPAV
jgi:hypothetical protein